MEVELIINFDPTNSKSITTFYTTYDDTAVDVNEDVAEASNVEDIHVAWNNSNALSGTVNSNDEGHDDDQDVIFSTFSDTKNIIGMILRYMAPMLSGNNFDKK